MAEKHNGKKRLYILPVFVRFLITLLLAGLSFVFAQENAVSQSAVKDIPLPRQSAYTGRGFAVGLGMGVFDPSDECDCLGVWQGQADYFYTPWLSGGAEVRFFPCASKIIYPASGGLRISGNFTNVTNQNININEIGLFAKSYYLVLKSDSNTVCSSICYVEI